MENKYLIRKVNNNNNLEDLYKLYDRVFLPEEVGQLAKKLANNFPYMENKHWFLAEEKDSKELAAGLSLIPSIWEMEGVHLKVAEQGLVATDEKHRGKGIMKMLNREFDDQLEQEKYDLAVIQGIPGFYHKFGYHYAIPMENHINLDLRSIKEIGNSGFKVRQAELNDIPFLLDQDQEYRKTEYISVLRDKKIWEYLLTHSKETDCGCDCYIFESNLEKFYCKIMYQGFGKGLNISEISYSISDSGLQFLLSFLKKQAVELKKPFIRFNFNNTSRVAKYLISLGSEEGKTYAWQIKIPNKLRLLNKIKPIMEARIQKSEYNDYSGILQLNFYKNMINLKFNKGTVESIHEEMIETENSFCIPDELFASLVLGHRSWEELQYIHPQVSPMILYLNPELKPSDELSGKLINILFPKRESWVYLQY